MRFWVSWCQPTIDPRPLNFPPNENILGWWISGYDNEERSILCAVVETERIGNIEDIVKVDWPEAEDWRFTTHVADDFIPSDRFPLKEWMIDRFNIAAKEKNNGR